MKNRVVVSAVIAGLAITMLNAGKAQAIPAFARQYKTECSTCHTVFPDRNPFGEAFRKNSFVWPGKLAGQKQEEAKLVTEDQKKTAQEWLVTIPELVPVAFWVQHDFVYNKDKTPQIDLDGETEFELFTGGAFRDKAGWWAEYNFGPENSLGEAYIQIRKPFAVPLNVKAGKFKPQLSLWKPNDSATISEYGFYGMTVGDSPFEIGREQGGVELNSVIGNRFFVATGVNTQEEKDRNGPDWYGHAAVRIGGTDYNGNAPEISLERESVWDNLALTFGTFGYLGSSLSSTNDFYRLGFEGEALYKKLRFRVNGILGQDDSPSLATPGASEKSLFLMAQGQYIFMRNVLAAMRFEYQDIENDAITRRYIPSVTYAPWQNVRLALEYVHEKKSPKDATIASETNREGVLRVSFAF